ncbi:thiolase family protein [Vineibacter terrae]|uniref:thiolase family protein n=1 Tax=Vineibacter terrae TaxID=2586908 RepID=UPI002E355779|nr:thiolase family protein [Vineibacter terrae]HEX2891797.1 thiolase family protein [Vineibacter terrae]
MTKQAFIVGIGETPPTRRSSKDIRALAVDAVDAALADAGLPPTAIDGIVTDGLIMPNTVPHEYITAQYGMDRRRFDGSISYGGTGIVCAPMIAKAAIDAGLAETVLCYFGVDWGTRASGPYGFHDLYPAKLAFEKPVGFNGQPSYFALWARRYMHEFGATEEDLAAIAIAQRSNALRNPRSQSKKPLDLEAYRASRMISDPLRAADCCVISDGVCAFIVTTAERARDLRQKPVKIMGCGFGTEPVSGDDIFTQRADLLRIPGAAAAVQQALRQADLTLDDVDFAEIYDCFTISCLMQIESMGFCGPGEAGPFVRERGTTVDGRLPINTHGGLLSYSYLLGAEHVIEAVRQLRGEAGAAQVADAQVGLVSGLSVPDYGVLLLGRPT